MTGSREISLEHLTLLDVAPPDLVSLAADAGFDAVSLRISPATDGEEPWPVGPGSPMLAETTGRLAGTGIRVLGAEAVRLDHDPRGWEPVVATAAALGARYLNAISDDADLARLADRFGRLARLAVPCGVRPVIEFMSYKPVRSLAAALDIAAQSDGGRVLVDALHVQRCGVDLGELARADPALLGYVQLCDAPLEPPAGRPPPGSLPRGQPPAAAWPGRPGRAAARAGRTAAAGSAGRSAGHPARRRGGPVPGTVPPPVPPATCAAGPPMHQPGHRLGRLGPLTRHPEGRSHRARPAGRR